MISNWLSFAQIERDDRIDIDGMSMHYHSSISFVQHALLCDYKQRLFVILPSHVNFCWLTLKQH
jgi:hypothetical protein